MKSKHKAQKTTRQLDIVTSRELGSPYAKNPIHGMKNSQRTKGEGVGYILDLNGTICKHAELQEPSRNGNLLLRMSSQPWASAELASHYALLLVSCSPGSVKVRPEVLSRSSPQAQSTSECSKSLLFDQRSMKYPQLVPMPSAVQDWLDEQLEARGIDAVVYTRYILSLLQRDSTDLPDNTLSLSPGKGKKQSVRSQADITAVLCVWGSLNAGKSRERPCALVTSVISILYWMDTHKSLQWTKS
uniref:Uncharacterized protein n=1 Tax=Timema monikensis TaxID=170555 RepID=A0A7R9HPS1_9NEOP|nr:unnamed protein product [Timema monikensis]